MDNDFNDTLNFQLERVFASMGRNLITLLEDLKFFHQNNFDKLYENLPPELHKTIDSANYFDENSYQHYRGKIFDIVMSAKRDLKFTVNDNNLKDN